MLKPMRMLLVGLVILSFSGITPAALANIKPRILPFKVWKQKKIDEAKSVVLELKHDRRKQSQVKNEDNSEDQQDEAQKLSQAELNLGLTKELSANDYFLLYVSPQFKGNSEALTQAAKTLSPKDMADILNAYQKKLQATSDSYNGSDAPPTPPEDVPSVPQIPQTEKTAKAP
jgi:hypothetical protein